MYSQKEHHWTLQCYTGVCTMACVNIGCCCICTGSAQGDDIKVILAELSLAHSYLETANNILQHYRDFCKRVSSCTWQYIYYICVYGAYHHDMHVRVLVTEFYHNSSACISPLGVDCIWHYRDLRYAYYVIMLWCNVYYYWYVCVFIERPIIGAKVCVPWPILCQTGHPSPSPLPKTNSCFSR